MQNSGQNLKLKQLPILFLICLLGFLTTGCGPQKKPSGSVSGKVESAGKPVTSGRVVFSSEDLGVSQAETVQPDGTFKTTAPLPTGIYRVYLLPPDQGDIPPGLANQQPATRLENVPEKYQSEKSTDLMVTIEKGDNPLVLDLKP